MSVLQFITLVGEAVLLVPVIQGFFSTPNPTNMKHSVRLALGQTVDTAQSFGGNVPGVALWDFIGGRIGKQNGASEIVPQGSFRDIEIEPMEQGKNDRANYISITNGGNDAVCLAGLLVSFPDGGKSGFSTSIAAKCGAFWSYSSTPILDAVPDSKDQPEPVCIWIDRDGSNGIPHQGMGIHLPSFNPDNKNLGKTYSKDDRLMCRSGPRFRMYPQLRTEDPILVFPDGPPKFFDRSNQDDEDLIGTDMNPGYIIENPGKPAQNFSVPARVPVRLEGHKRGTHELTKRARKFNGVTEKGRPAPKDNDRISVGENSRPYINTMSGKVVVTPQELHSARKLCESGRSWGRSFASLSEGLFCDMSDKTLHFICNKNGKPTVTSCCYDTGTDKLLACHKDSPMPITSKTKKTVRRAGRINYHGLEDAIPAMEKREAKAFDDVQRWE